MIETLNQQEVVKQETVNTEVAPVTKNKSVLIIEEIIQAHKSYQNTSSIITSIGTEEINSIKYLSKVLDTPMKNIIGEKNSPQESIANSLIDIKSQADLINPANFDLNPGFFGRMLGKLTGNSAINKYVTKYSSAADVIQSISKSLDLSVLKLREDIALFEQDKARFREAADKLKEKIDLLLVLDSSIEERIAAETNEDTKKILQEEVLFSVRTHTQDLQQTYIASQQGIAAISVLIQNNKELIRGVERTQRVAIPVMSIGFTIATGLATQKKILDLTNNINQATSDTMLQNSRMLKEQGAQIQKQASSATLDIEKITLSMQELVLAIEDVETYKQKALPELKKSIGVLKELSEKVDTKIDKMKHSDFIEQIHDAEIIDTKAIESK